jgi:bacillithiol biosynthesis cysteine-adding enzyme BshC
MNVEFDPTPVGTLPRAAWRDIAARRGRRLSPGLRPAFTGEAVADGRLDALLAGNALCVTTGQQPGLFLGPLFTLYKALSAVALAERLEALLARTVVPVFWVAGDDHDFLEASHTYQLSRSSELARLALPERPAAAPLTPMYRERLGPAVTSALDALWQEQPETEFRSDVQAWLARHYVPDATIAGAFGGALAELLGPLGLLVFDPTHHAAKEAMRPVLLGALRNAQTLDVALARQAAALQRNGAAAPVPVGEGASLVMLEGSHGRDRLILEQGAFHARRSGERYSLSDLTALAEEAPERFSPNVLLRPVVEAAILPTVAYVGGPGELAYFPQAAPAYQMLGVDPQVPIPRWSALAIEARTRKVMDKYALAPDDLRLPEGQLEQRLVRGDLPEAAEAALTAIRDALEREYGVLREAAAAIDPTLQKPVESTRNAALAGARDIEKRLISHLKQRNDTLVQQLARVRAAVFPLGKPQERVLGVPPFLVRYGREFLTTALAEVRAWAAALEAPRHGQ